MCMQVLDGYVWLGNTATLNEETMNSFASAVSSSALRVIRGVVLTRQGLENKARSSSMVQELVKLLPPDLFRTCLARVSAPPNPPPTPPPLPPPPPPPSPLPSFFFFFPLS